MQQLIEKIKAFTKETGGTWGISLKDMQTDEAWAMNGDERFHAASVIKVPIMAAVFQAIEKGHHSLAEKIALQAEELVGGTGVLQHMTPGTKLTIEDLLLLMIIQSDNTATNMMIELVGRSAIQNFIAEQEMKNTILHNKLMLPPEERGKGFNQTSAHDNARLLEKMYHHTLVSEDASKQMLAMMKKQQITNCLPHFIRFDYPQLAEDSPKWQIGHKTGSISKHRHDVGLFYVNDRAMVVSVLSRDAYERDLEETIARIGEAVFNYLLNH